MKHVLKNSWIIFSLFVCILLFSVYVLAETKKPEKEMTVTSGNTVLIEYTLKLEDKSVVDSNVGLKPMTYTPGSNQIIPGLEKALDGMKVGDSKKVTIKPEEGYGLINKDAIIEINKDQVPKDALEIGARLQGQDADGRIVQAVVSEIKDKTVVLDLNHFLAGKTLYFDVKVLDIK